MPCSISGKSLVAALAAIDSSVNATIAAVRPAGCGKYRVFLTKLRKAAPGLS
jgi:hypothetical protein